MPVGPAPPATSESQVARSSLLGVPNAANLHDEVETPRRRWRRGRGALYAFRVLKRLSRLFAVILLVVHGGLALWGVAGFLELALPSVPWARLSNPLFSPSMLALQWTLICAAAMVFIAGDLARWRHTPRAMAGIYGAMAAVCAYQTFFILTSPTRFWAMAIEYVEYVVILLFLFRSDHMCLRFAVGVGSDVQAQGRAA